MATDTPTIIDDLEAGHPSLSLAEAAKDPLLRRNGRERSRAAVWRWALKGARGVKLETLHATTGRITTRPAIRRFLAQLDAGSAGPPVKVASGRERATAKARARAVLDSAGIR